MSATNPTTAQAATQSYQAPLRPMSLIGIFKGGDADRILMRNRGGDIVALVEGEPNDGLTLTEAGEGWAMVMEGATIHRLVIG